MNDSSKITVTEVSREIPVKYEADVVICGGGAAGVPAAIAAARLGMKVVLVEAYGFLGGTNTVSGVNGVGAWQYDLDGRPLIAGIPEYIMERLAQIGGANPEDVKDVFTPREKGEYKNFGGLGSRFIRTNPELMKILLDRIMKEEGIKVLLHCNAVLPIMDGNKVKGIFIESKSGREAILAKIVIDCTGDGDIAARAGAPFEIGRPGDHACQPMTTIFTAAGYSGHVRLNYTPGADESMYPELTRNRYEKAIKLARERGEIVQNPNDIFCASTPLNYLDPSVQSVNFTRIQMEDATDVEQLTEAEVLGREQVLEAINFMKKYIDVCENCYLVSIPPRIGIRESRRIMGEYVLTGEDIKNGVRFSDGIMRGIYLIDIHNPTEIGKPSVLEILDQPYDIPYRCLVPREIDGLLVAGRCISGDHIAHASYRVMSHCMALGEAAGVAAALAVEDGIEPRHIDADKLRNMLVKKGANIGPN